MCSIPCTWYSMWPSAIVSSGRVLRSSNARPGRRPTCVRISTVRCSTSWSSRPSYWAGSMRSSSRSQPRSSPTPCWSTSVTSRSTRPMVSSPTDSSSSPTVTPHERTSSWTATSAWCAPVSPMRRSSIRRTPHVRSTPTSPSSNASRSRRSSVPWARRRSVSHASPSRWPSTSDSRRIGSRMWRVPGFSPRLTS